MVRACPAPTDENSEPSPPVEVSIVVVGYGAPEWLDRCLGSLAGEGLPALAHEVVLVDNASTPPLRKTLTSDLSRVRLVELEHNVGFGRACNLGASLAGGKRVLFLNPDTEVRPGAISTLASFLDEDPLRGLVGGRTLAPDGSVDPASVWGAPSLWSEMTFATGLSTLFKNTKIFDPESLGWWGYDTVREVGVITGCLLMGRRETFAALGGFDEAFFMYGEDVDLSARARRAGYRPSFTPDATVVHAKGATSSSTTKVLMVMRGKATLARQGCVRPLWWLSRTLLVSGVALRAAQERLRGGDGRWHSALAERSQWLKGWADVPRPPLTLTSDSGAVAHAGTDTAIDLTVRDTADR